MLIQQSTWDGIVTPNAAATSAARPTAYHTSFGYSESTSLGTNSSLGLSIQFLRGNTPTAKFAVWTFLEPHLTIAHLVLMGHDSRICSKHRIYFMFSPTR